MKNKKLQNLCLIAVFVFTFFGAAKAQKGILQLSNGVTIAIKTQTTPPNETTEGYGNIYGRDDLKNNTFHRILTDIKNKIYFGYDLSVEPLAEKGKYSVSIKPLTKELKEFYEDNAFVFEKMPKYDEFTARSLPEYPSGIILRQGDTLSLDILENPQTKSKITDVIAITNDGRNFGDYFSGGKPPKDFTIEDVQIGLKEIKIYIDGKLYKSSRAGISGAAIWIYFPGKGRFIMSPFEQPGYNFQKIGVINNSQITFNYDGSAYKFVSKDFVIGYVGKWNLWVMLDPDYKPTMPQAGLTFNTTDGLILGSVQNVKNLFEE